MQQKKKKVNSIKKRFKPPKCSGCKTSLFTVYENECWTYFFDKTSGTYKGELVDIDILCPDCHAKLWDVFPEGTCNYGR
ncbi:MAG: hypothetical protein ABIK93_00965 [candidate division WOR-3 bacterium]